MADWGKKKRSNGGELIDSDGARTQKRVRRRYGKADLVFGDGYARI